MLETVTLKLPSFYPKQKQAFFCPERISATHASTKAGKTVGAVGWQLAELHGVGRGKSHLWVSPVYSQAKNVFERVVRMLTRADPEKLTWDVNKSDLAITFAETGSRWYFKGSDNPDSIYGADYASVVVDEASRCKEAAWHAVVSTTTKTRGKIRAIGNVVGRKDWFYHLCQKAKAGEPGMAYNLITWKDAVEAKVLDFEVVEEQRRSLPPMVFRSLYECVPSEDGANPFGYESIAACVKPQSILPPICFGVDLAKSHDWTVIIGLDATKNVAYFERWQAPWEVTGPKLVQIIGNLPALVDSSGVGDPIVERIKRSCTLVEGYQTGAGSKKTGLIHGLIMSVQQGKLGFPDGVIRTEMESYEYSLTDTQRISYSAPQGSHDDCVVSLALADMQADKIGATCETSLDFLDEQDTWEAPDDRVWRDAGF